MAGTLKGVGLPLVRTLISGIPIKCILKSMVKYTSNTVTRISIPRNNKSETSNDLHKIKKHRTPYVKRANTRHSALL